MKIDPDYVNKNFIKDKPLTTEMIGQLDKYQVNVLCPKTPLLGRLLHCLRYFFSFNYHAKFDAAAASYIKDHKDIQATETPVNPIEPQVVNRALQKSIPQSVEKSLGTETHHPLNANTQKVLNAIGANPKLGPQAKDLWQTLFQRFADAYQGDCLTKVEEKSGTFTLHFSKPLKLFLRSLDDEGKEDPPGGAVLTFAPGGKFKLKLGKNGMELEGLSTFSKTPAMFRVVFGDTVEAALVKFMKSATGFETVAKKFPKTVSRDRPYEAIKENWGKKAVILPSDASPEEVIMSGNY